MKEKLGKLLKYSLSAALAAALLYLAFRKVEWTEFSRELAVCDWGYILLSMLAGTVAFAIRGVRWKQILMPLDSGTELLTTVNGVNISNMANLFIPFCGEFVRSGIVTRRSTRDAVTGKPVVTYDRALGTAALERFWDILSVIILLAVLLIFKRDQFSGFLVEKVWNPVFGHMHLVGFFALALLTGLIVAGCFAIRHYRERYRICGRIYGVICRLLEGFSSCLHMKGKGLFFIYTLLIWAMYWLQMVLIAKAMPSVSGVMLEDALFLMLIGSFASCLPVPGGFGAYHYIVSVAMSSIYGFPREGVGIAFATISHESQAVTMVVTGLASYVSECLRRKGPQKQVN